jgi:hypothetical protein
MKLAAGHWSLVAGCWLLVSGHWPLASGHWYLVAGPLVTASTVASKNRHSMLDARYLMTF